MAKYRNITKLSKPGLSTPRAIAVNLYRDGTFRLAYKYEGWETDAVQEEIKLLKNRFPDYKGWKVEKG